LTAHASKLFCLLTHGSFLTVFRRERNNGTRSELQANRYGLVFDHVLNTQKPQESGKGEQMAFPRRQQGIALTIIIIMLAAFFLMSIPLSPSLAVTLSIDTKQYTPILTVTSFAYSKVPLPVALVTTRDVPFLAGSSPTTGTSQLRFTVSYAGTVLSDYVFVNLGDGTYQVKVLYSPRPEQSGTGYVVAMTLTAPNSQTASATVNIFP
jgi:hypothetical protein